MGTRRTTNSPADPQRPVPRPSPGNPFQQIMFERRDLQGMKTGGGPKREFVVVDAAYREALAASLDDAAQQVFSQMQAHPHLLAPLMFRLRQEAIAKSHRPVKLAEESGLVSAGHERVEEMLVGAHAGSIAALRSVILERDIKAVRANLSAIVRIEPWGRAQRNPEGTLAVQQQGRALLRFFRYGNDAANARLFDGVRGLLAHLGLKHRFFRQGRHGWFYASLLDLSNVNEEKFDELLSFPGLRRLLPEPRLFPMATATAGTGAVTAPNMPPPMAGLPTVAVFDTGTAAAATDLRPWVVRTKTYVLPPDTDHQHGTNVASLVAGARGLNAGHGDLPPMGAMVYDVCGLESASGGYVGDIILRLEDAIRDRPDVRVWNLSLGTSFGCDEQTFSEFAQTLDQLSDQYNVLFVVAAGNYLTEPRRTWPALATLQDQVSCPGESVRALTVGSICHIGAPDALNEAGEPAAYSRRGPGPVFTPKPDIVHVGGGVHAPWSSGAASVAVLTSSNAPARGFGTSFAAPIASSMAAHAWDAIAGGTGLTATPALVKALMIHAAQLSSPPYTPWERRYYGAGLPKDVVAALYDRDDSFTLIFESRLVPSLRWRKAPYPIPSGLMQDGKFRGEVIITAVYAPPLDGNAGAEYVRANVELSFGTLDGDNIHSKVPLKGEDGTDGYESAQVEHGGKWAPVKVHRKVFTNGIGGETWALQARMFLREFEPALAEGLTVYILCTLRSLDGDSEIHAQGMRALMSTNWVRQDLPVRVPVQALT
ncbi:peptidase [beta proteobacterium AAP121]|nr:peptidase [beta proteobacterium AAP65]KPF96409.1 peptidase [beta proteobacterium AAP121]